MTAINPGFAGTDIQGGFYTDLDKWIDDFFSGAWLPDYLYDTVDLVPTIIYGPPGGFPPADFPVGETDLPIPAPGTSIPPLVPQPPLNPVVTIPEEVDRRDQDDEVVALTDEEWLAIYHPELVIGDPVYLVPEEEEDVSVFEDIYDVIDTGVGGILPGGVPPFWEGGPTPSIPPMLGPGPTIGLPIPAPGGPTTVIPGTGGHGGIDKHDSYKLVNGVWKWVHTRRKRCRRLLTASQARDLQLLMSITGKSSELTKIIVARGGLC